MRIALLYSLLIYQLLQHCDAEANCRPLSEVRATSFEDLTATVHVNRGSNIQLYSRIDHCNDPRNNNYVLLHQNHHTGELDVISQQRESKFTLSDIQLNTSGIYCTYKQCVPKDKDQCCIRIMVSPPEMKIIFPDLVHNDAQVHGACYARAWPQLTTNDMDVLTDSSCAITKGPVTIIDTYTTAVYFTLDNINSSCQRISCLTDLKEEIKYINIKHATTTTPTTTPSAYETYNFSPTLGHVVLTKPSKPNDTPIASGVLGIYRITLWIIVLTLTLLSTAITSLTPGYT